MNTIDIDEISVGMYAKHFGISKANVYYRIKQGKVQWRYLFPETQEYIVIKRDSYVPDKVGRKKKEVPT